MENNNLIQTFDLEDLESEMKRHQFSKKLRASLSTTGFFFLKNHNMPELLIQECAELSKQFFALSNEQKLAYENTVDHQHGYTPLGKEAGEHAQKTPDEKEFFQFRENGTPTVQQIPGFTEKHLLLFAAFRNVYVQLLSVVATSIGLERDFFNAKEGNSLVRSILYPPKANPLSDDAAATKGGNAVGMCASRHTDINFLTLLLARKKGLQLWHEKRWREVTISDPNLMIVNCGDMLEHFTAGNYLSGEHRVVCEPNIPRPSTVFFGHINEWESVKPLEHLFPDYDKEKYPYDKAGVFLHDRLVKIGLMSA